MIWDLNHVAYAGAALGIMAIMVLALARGFFGPTIFDRVLAANMFGTKTVLLIAVYGFLTDRPDFLDIAITYALINFIGVIAVLKVVERVADGKRPEDL
ncbi:monovalent cation/H+ antiporter complex subunit F [Thiocapsa rosea]|uniref:Multisubunit sodium/proton antiporter MrpF subunit n=1 Tax=Thiocapsa rosea TaxID=69360 RepID=A0A495V455_9GAMM|nr:monovalent cation/H+ antiporter complex subunit F [Thiocapsa rosea]RKT43345.1 multisubunit sodium/proton antiporter MrpF subunit [Thiocapsa rosea]